MISGEVRSTPSGGIGAISLSRLHAEASSAPRMPASNIVEERCVAAGSGGDEGAGKETISTQRGSLSRSKMVDNVLFLRPP